MMLIHMLILTVSLAISDAFESVLLIFNFFSTPFNSSFDQTSLLINIISEPLYFTSQYRKMVRHTLKILQQMLQDLLSVSDHFTTLRSNGLILYTVTEKYRNDLW